MRAAMHILQQAFGKDSEQAGNCYLEQAQVHAKAKSPAQAIECQSQAYQIFESIPKYAASDFLANILVNMAELQERAEQYDGALASLQGARQILIDNYSEVDRRTCKVKRNISLLFLK